ncbi:unnamed protein product [Notodromas monacha]|uniref:Chitin-binding type-2 domain-containing protein n=1 Tax=Notodromas monacha TaxID=399045 RepID=A0A7R9BLM8_9CRUS|nr:unnamed protein product [Notodromas monacha]CAG0916280.1 unnamed protein product [Notodromas monacha]
MCCVRRYYGSAEKVMSPVLTGFVVLAAMAYCGEAQYFSQQPLYYAGDQQQQQQQQPQQRPQRVLVQQQQQPRRQPVLQQVYKPQDFFQQPYEPQFGAQQLRPISSPVNPAQRNGAARQLSSSSSSGCPDEYPTEDPSQCDKYYACENGERVEKLCADGLVFNPRVSRSRRNDPCFYPQEVECGSRSERQPAQPSDQCPHQFALFGTGDRANCGQYVSCANGVAYTLPCPADLAFSDDTGRCEWPDEVRTCDASAYLQFSCPPPSAEGALDYYPDPSDRRRFFVCVDGLPRRITCGEDSEYNPETQTCYGGPESAERANYAGNGQNFIK